MGSATCYQLARRGQRVLGLERFDIPHTRGSSHGYTRIIRLAYHEDPSYVNLLKRAYELWADIEKRAAEKLLYITGSLNIGLAGNETFEGAYQSVQQYALAHEILSSKDITQRYPAYSLPPEYFGLYQPQGGFLLPERSIVAFTGAAMSYGAQIQAREQVLDYQPTAGGGVRVTTDKGVYEAGRMVVTSGAWNARLMPFLQDLAVPERQVLAWLQPHQPEYFRPDTFPVFIMDMPEGVFYGFPVFAVPGFKFGKYHHLAETGDPDTLLTEPNQRDEGVLRDFASRYFPGGAGPTMSLASCMFTNAPDGHFIIDRHPELEQVYFASACSGHGFKFASVIGEIMADLAEKGETSHDISFFRLGRFSTPGV